MGAASCGVTATSVGLGMMAAAAAAVVVVMGLGVGVGAVVGEMGPAGANRGGGRPGTFGQPDGGARYPEPAGGSPGLLLACLTPAWVNGKGHA